jgi:hypothetical protein
VTDLLATDAIEYDELKSYGLGPGDEAVVIGAYRGKTILTLLDMYPGIRVRGFEPQRPMYDACVEAVRGTDAIIYDYGLGERSEAGLRIGDYNTDAASFVEIPGQRGVGEGEIRDVAEVFAMIFDGEIALTVCNIEGYEYKLLPRLIDTGWIHRMRYLLIQFHLSYITPEEHDAVIARLLETHRIRWQNDWVWASFERKS